MTLVGLQGWAQALIAVACSLVLFFLYGWRERRREKRRVALWLLAQEDEFTMLRESFLTVFGLNFQGMLFQFDHDYEQVREYVQRGVAIIAKNAEAAGLTDRQNWLTKTAAIDGVDKRTFQEILYGRQLANQFFYLALAIVDKPSPVRVTQKDRLKNLLVVARSGKKQADKILLDIALIKAGYRARLLHHLRIKRIANKSPNDVLLDGAYIV